MTTPPRILVSCGTRPEIIKLAPVYLALRARNVDVVLSHTGQHRELACDAFAAFGIKPDYSSEREEACAAAVPTASGSCDLSRLDAMLLEGCDRNLGKAHPSIVIVQGDTSSAVMMAWAAFHRKVPIAHVEAGLRTHRRDDPFPEEMNRVLIARLADWHFAPTTGARDNLLREGVPPEAIYVVGNTVVDALRLARQTPIARNPNELSLRSAVAERLSGRRLLLVTSHRRENQPTIIGRVAREVRTALERDERLVVVWPLHPNPIVRNAVQTEFADLAPDASTRCFLTDAVSYGLLQWILARCWVVLTDSGGIQEEAAILRRPALVFRECTERSELIESGSARLVRPDEVSMLIAHLESDAATYAAMVEATHPYGDGHAAGRICEVLLGRNV